MTSDLESIVQKVVGAFTQQMENEIKNQIDLEQSVMAELKDFVVETFNINGAYREALLEEFSGKQLKEIRNFLDNYEDRIAAISVSVGTKLKVEDAEEKIKDKLIELLGG
jgi:hypothetical protein